MVKRVSNSPSQRFITYSGFQMAQELGWHDQRAISPKGRGAEGSKPSRP